MPSPRQTFDDNIRPAQLLLRIYCLLDSDDKIHTHGELVDALRKVVRAAPNEYLMVVYNGLFLGLVHERADLPPATLLRATLAHLLRQAVVVSCTALETYLPTLLRANLPTVIQALGRGFMPVDDNTLGDYFRDLKFELDETLRLLEDPNAATYIANKMIGLMDFKYVSGRKGVHVVGRLLGLDKPWDMISAHLRRDAEKKELMATLDLTVARRNDIVHRADRSVEALEGEQQAIAYSFARQSVDTIQLVCLALDELVAHRMVLFEAIVRARE